ncbi:MAG: OmpA family protein [Bryobacterales bacterium]|nr:OmpA family protein [Bryobacterales bacterium]
MAVRSRAPHQRHGGAWKVAYADFVTALMALFIVLWMMNASAAVKENIQGYFRDPRGYSKAIGAGSGGAGEGLSIDKHSVRDVQNQIELALRSMPEFQRLRDNVLISVTGEGLRIDLVENEQGMFFLTGDPTPTDAGAKLMRMLGTELRNMPNKIAIEGHTDSRPFRNSAPDSLYTNWELASDRANAARRLLYTSGIRTDQIVEVRGFADNRLMNEGDPNDARNRRVSVVVKFSGQH